MKKWRIKKLVPKCIRALYYANKKESNSVGLDKNLQYPIFAKKQGCENIEFDELGLLKEKAKNEFKEFSLDPDDYILYPMQETVMVKLLSQSPVDMLAARIGNRIIKEGLCNVSKSEMAGNYEKYTIEVVISKRIKNV